MSTYPKLDTLYTRGADFNVVPGSYSRPEFGLINDWIITEKIEGTNIRLDFRADLASERLRFDVLGRTDQAQIPRPLLTTMNDWCQLHRAEVFAIMERYELTTYTLYGEGYGAGIESGGHYRADQGFILFDVGVNGHWLDHRQVANTSFELRLEHVPILGRMTEQSAVELVRNNQLSAVADAHRRAEGVVARPAVPLFDRRGERVMWKLKTRDFTKGKQPKERQ